MKNLDEKKMLARMARNMGQPDLKLEESIRLEEELNSRLFKKPQIQILKEEIPPAPPAFEPPKKADIVQQTVNAISSPKFAKNELPDFQKAELDGIRKQIAELVQRMGTLSWGGGGTGVVRINDTDDFDRTSYGEGRTMRWVDGAFRLTEHTTTYVTSNNYIVLEGDCYVGVNNASYTTITLPTTVINGKMVIIKDESGFAQLNPIKIVGNIDNDPEGAEIRINNGAVQLLYRNGWRIV
jgi:hypothetical protein